MKEKELINYIKSFGIDVRTSTKARGHQGFYLKNRIDISKDLPEERKIPTLIHEFAHYVHSKIEKNIDKTGGTLETVFGTASIDIEKELIEVTHFVDENSLCKKLFAHKDLIKQKIKEEENIIKSDYPNFMRSKKFKEFERYIKKSDARYLLKYDRVRVVTGFWRKTSRIFSIANVEKDFPSMPKAFCAYIRLKSYMKKQARISARINKYNKYYRRPTELFARFVEGLYFDRETVKHIAPNAYRQFLSQLEKGRYKELKNMSELLNYS